MTSVTKSTPKSTALKQGAWTDAALKVLEERYLHRRPDGTQETPEEMVWRVAQAIAEAEREHGATDDQIQTSAEQFYDLMIEGKFIPNSPTLMNAGLGANLQYSACYVLPVEDSIEGIFESIQHAAIVHQSGGGTGFAFSRLRPNGNRVQTSGGVASGPVSFMRVFDAATEAIKQGGRRRGANMGILRVDHPDIEEFIVCKLDGGITNFNISVAATDAFMDALTRGEDYDLIAQPGWPAPDGGRYRGGEVIGQKNAREIFDKIVKAAWGTGDPGLVFIDRVNDSPANPTPEVGLIEATNPCGEQPLMSNEACNLGSVDLAKFVHPRESNGADPIDWEGLEAAVRLAVRFLDNVITVNPYPLPEIDEAVKANRRIGLGVMGWADMLFELGIPYDSQEAIQLAEEVMGFINRVGHDEDEKLAEARGPFPNWQRSIYKDGRPLRNSTVTTIAPTGSISIIAGTSSGIEPIFALAFRHVVKQPEGGERKLSFVNPAFERVAKERGFWSETLMAEIARRGTCHGVEGVPPDVQRVFVTAHEVTPEWHIRTQAAFQKQTDNGVSKCVAGDTLIFTDQGIISIASLYQEDQPDSFRPINLTVADNPAPVAANLFYYGGEQPVVGMETDLGITLRATPNHRVRIVRGGEIVWCHMDELKEGDYIVASYGYGIFGHRHEFSQIYGAPYRPAGRTNAIPIQWPYKITTDLARALGYLVADGGFNQNSVIFTQVASEVLADYSQIMQRRLGLTPRISADKRREETKSAVINSRDLVAFFSEYLGCGRGAENKRTPDCILQTGPEIQKQYIRGLTLDGYVSRGNGRFVVVGTVSRQLAVEVQAMLLNLGIPARLETQPIHYDYIHEENRKEHVYNVVIVPAFRRSFLERIGYAEARKQAAAWTVLRQAENKIQPGTSYVIPGVRPLAVCLAQQKRARARSRKLKSYLYGFINARAEITRHTLLYLLDICRDLEDTPEWQTLDVIATRQALYTPVTRIWWDKAFVYDLQVPETHSFITNGFISHNTVNLPNKATVDDVAQAYRLAYETGCLGITVFRDGCKGEQVLNVGVSESASQRVSESASQRVSESASPTSQTATPRPRPAVLAGATYRKNTPLGAAYITINTNGEGKNQPFEVFVNIGKAGSDTTALAEALGRLISLILRLSSPLSPFDRVKDIVGQLRGIGSGRAMGFGPQRVMSLPDAVAQVLAEHVGLTGTEPLPGLPDLDNETRQLSLFPGADLCPECGQATFVMEEGCKKCYACGFSEC